MGTGPEQHLILTHSLLLGERLYLFARLRFLAAAGILVGSFFATYVVGIRGLDLSALALAAIFLAAYNVGIFLFVRRRVDDLGEVQKERRLVSVAHVSILLDYLVLTFCIWRVGGAQSPFLTFYLLHAILASVLLSRRAAYAHALVGYVLLACLVLGEWSGLLPAHRPIGSVPGQGELELRGVLTILFVYALLTAVTTILTSGIVRLLRENEQGLREASDDLERLADMRRSFLHVVLHDVRSPVGTVVSMLEGLAGGIDGEVSAAQASRLGRASERLRGVLELLRGLRVLADLETERLDSLMVPTDLEAVIREVVEDQWELAAERGQSIVTEVPPSLPAVRVVETLIREAVTNYLTNAIKYAGNGARIIVRALARDGHVRVEVIDNGPGIALEDQAHLFREFTRVGRARGKQGAAAGLGLGLSIVKRIADAHGGTAGMCDASGGGSLFYLELPILR
jgi:signal transduction histidine kinase